MPSISGNAPSRVPATFARQPSTLPQEFDIDRVQVGKGDSVWKIAKRELGESATEPEITDRMNAYIDANKERFEDLSKLVPGDELIRPPLPQKPQETRPTWSANPEAAPGEAPAPAAPAEPGAPEAAAQAQMDAARQAAETQHKADLDSLQTRFETLVGKATVEGGTKVNPNLSDADKTNIAGLARDMFADADRLGVGESAHSVPGGKILQGIVDDVDRAATVKGLRDVAQKSIDLANGQRSPLTDGQKSDVALKAAPLLDAAKRLMKPEDFAANDDVKRLQGIVDEVDQKQAAVRSAFRRSEITEMNAADAKEKRAIADSPEWSMRRLIFDLEIVAKRFDRVSPSDISTKELGEIQGLVDQAKGTKLEERDSFKILASKLTAPRPAPAPAPPAPAAPAAPASSAAKAAEPDPLQYTPII